MNCGVPCLLRERRVEKYVGRNLYWINLWDFHGSFAVRNRLRKTLGDIYGKPHSRHHFRGALRLSHHRHA
jgi:hypothetical protein